MKKKKKKKKKKKRWKKKRKKEEKKRWSDSIPWELGVLLDDLIEGGEHGGNGVIRGADVPLRVTARQLLHQVPHSVLP